MSDGQQVELMYLVTGWFTNPDNDPINSSLTPDDIETKHNWTFSPSTTAPSCSFYNGATQSVIWHPSVPYLPSYSGDNTPEVELDLTIGNNPAETISVFLKELSHPELPYFEVLLNAYFQGLLNTLKQPAAGQLAAMEQALQEKEFRSIKAEYLYSVVTKIVAPDGSIQYIGLDDLPSNLGGALNLLNEYAQDSQLLQASLAKYQWQLFSDWYRIFMSQKSTQQESYNIAYTKYSGITDMQNQVIAACNKENIQQQKVTAQLPEGCILHKVPAPRYWQPTEPVLMLSGNALPSMERYGGDGRFTAKGNLVCRLDSQLLTAVTINQVTINSTDFSAQNLPIPNGLPAPDTFNALIREACLLNTTLLSASVHQTITPQQMEDALLGKDTTLIVFTGLSPSPVTITWWNDNPWLPLFANWTVKFQPIFATTNEDQSQVIDYPTDFFTGNFIINSDNGAYASYLPTKNPIDPTAAPFLQNYSGCSVLATSAITGLMSQLGKSQDPTLQALFKQLQGQNMLMQSLSGLNAGFLMHQQDVQLNIAVPNGSEYQSLTQAIASAVGTVGQSAPDFNSYYNPARSGFFMLDLTLIDVFGQKKHVKQRAFNIAQSMTSFYRGNVIPSIAYLQPRLAIPARLLLRWLSADGAELEEMNSHPATNPICGWFLPNHVDGSLFLYNAQGEALGTLFFNGAKTKIMWQSAPGNDQTINQPIETVLAHENPHLKEVALALKNGSNTFFSDFMQAIDKVNAFVTPQTDASSNALSTLIGHPLALAQISVGLELQGGVSCNQSWSVLTLDSEKYPNQETDNAFSQINFPVILGDLNNLDDGLIGFFGQKNDSLDYNFSIFYTKGANKDSQSGIVLPGQNDLLLTPYPVNGVLVNDKSQYLKKTLVLVDPRAKLHATTGILPTKSIIIPSYMYQNTLRSLEMTFMCAPILLGKSAQPLPLPLEAGYQWSWVQEKKIASNETAWVVDPDISGSIPKGIWTYTPQTIAEGWLRLNPELLAFDLVNEQGKPVVISGKTNTLMLNIMNKFGKDLVFTPSVIVPEMASKTGSIFYIHFLDLVKQEDVPAINISAPNWSFSCLNDPQYGVYWAATPATGTPYILIARGVLAITISNIKVSTSNAQSSIYFDYYQIETINDGTYKDVLNVQSSSLTPVNII